MTSKHHKDSNPRLVQELEAMLTPPWTAYFILDQSAEVKRKGQENWWVVLRGTTPIAHVFGPSPRKTWVAREAIEYLKEKP